MLLTRPNFARSFRAEGNSHHRLSGWIRRVHDNLERHLFVQRGDGKSCHSVEKIGSALSAFEYLGVASRPPEKKLSRPSAFCRWCLFVPRRMCETGP